MDTKTRQYENFLRDDLMNPATIKQMEIEISRPNGNLREGMQKLFSSDMADALPLLQSSQDILGDSELAIEDFKKYIHTKSGLPTGERYLLIYGVLNAVYIQYQALDTLYDIFNLDKPASNLADIKNLRILQLRHKIAAHPLNYGRTKKATESFKLIRGSVTHPESIEVMNHKVAIEKFDMFQCLDEYSVQKELFLNDLLKVLINRLCDSEENKNELLKKLELISLGKVKSSTF